MIVVIPAEPETYLINRDGEILANVIAWQHVQGNLAYAVFPFNRQQPDKEEAFLHPDKSVSSPALMRRFETRDLWEASLDAVEATGVDTDGKDKSGQAERPINFGDKIYSTKSYWHWPVVNAIFEWPGKEPYPDDPRLVKIKREEYAELKRGGAHVIDPKNLVIEEEGSTEEQETEAAPAVDEDDDMDVV